MPQSKHILSAVRAADGATVFRTEDGHWSLFLDDAIVLCCDDADRVAATIDRRGDARVRDVAVVAVDTSGGPCVPLDAVAAAQVSGDAVTAARSALAGSWA